MPCRERKGGGWARVITGAAGSKATREVARAVAVSGEDGGISELAIGEIWVRIRGWNPRVLCLLRLLCPRNYCQIQGAPEFQKKQDNQPVANSFNLTGSSVCNVSNRTPFFLTLGPFNGDYIEWYLIGPIACLLLWVKGVTCVISEPIEQASR